MKNYYELLGISQTATEQEIKIAYRKLSQKFHPDKNDGDKFFEEMFKKIQEAYEVLGNAAQRKNYDLQLAKNANKQHTTAKNNFVPVIEIFSVNPPQVYSGEVITVSWKVFNADKITINLIGEVEAQGETTIRLNNLNANEFAEIKITATNTHINKATEKIIRVENKTYLEIKEKVKREMEAEMKRETEQKIKNETKKETLHTVENETNKNTVANTYTISNIAYINVAVISFMFLLVASVDMGKNKIWAVISILFFISCIVMLVFNGVKSSKNK